MAFSVISESLLFIHRKQDSEVYILYLSSIFSAAHTDFVDFVGVLFRFSNILIVFLSLFRFFFLAVSF